MLPPAPAVELEVMLSVVILPAALRAIAPPSPSLLAASSVPALVSIVPLVLLIPIPALAVILRLFMFPFALRVIAALPVPVMVAVAAIAPAPV